MPLTRTTRNRDPPDNRILDVTTRHNPEVGITSARTPSVLSSSVAATGCSLTPSLALTPAPTSTPSSKPVRRMALIPTPTSSASSASSLRHKLLTTSRRFCPGGCRPAADNPLHYRITATGVDGVVNSALTVFLDQMLCYWQNIRHNTLLAIKQHHVEVYEHLRDVCVVSVIFDHVLKRGTECCEQSSLRKDVLENGVKEVGNQFVGRAVRKRQMRTCHQFDKGIANFPVLPSDLANVLRDSLNKSL